MEVNELKKLCDDLTKFYSKYHNILTHAEINATIKALDAVSQISEKKKTDDSNFCIVVDKPDGTQEIIW